MLYESVNLFVDERGSYTRCIGFEVNELHERDKHMLEDLLECSAVVHQ
jgi:hypothetical protein